MTDTLSLALAQLNPTVGDIDGNLAKLRHARAEAAEQGADLVLTTELFLSGYPPDDLVLKRQFVAACMEAVEAFARETADGGPAVLLGTPWRAESGLHNAMALLEAGTVQTLRFKHDLPNYGVFDEKRVFDAGPLPGPVNFRGIRLGVPICEDIWTPEVVECLEESGAEILLVPNGSPFESDKQDERLNIATARIVESGLPLVYLNQLGGQDELVFDGGSFVLNADRSLALQMPSWAEQVTLTRWTRTADGWSCAPGEMTAPAVGHETIYQALVLGVRDYVRKNRFPGVVIGMSGGVDSALTAAIAVDALGADKVWTVMMPSPYTSDESLEDAAAASRLLGARLDSISIGPAMQAFDAMLHPVFDELPPDTTEENIQSRARGVTLMALSNKFGHMVLTTGNKSEMSVGYATLYGDMCGGYNALKDVYKTAVFDLCHWRNQADVDSLPIGLLGPSGAVMPERIITKPPSAELKPDQKDEDSLPPYPVLDAILGHLIEDEMPVSEIVANGMDRDLVMRIWRMLDRAEYKRRQAPPGVKITRRSFGRERRYPITNAFQGT
ncbi:MAG: NAD+ synthase [Alphaproteobacteria bacterium]|nr:NAD+ synthase [Alphaproteobacteria bacterium]MBU0797383.1 NAD+ synthase [Alphaproteobacteria bacterium]MBU0888101.1 NAD+ synthase [Alphaproteobacteria bacterium]MBU1811546.1 NAD+ synthase [Alphaproteobacteria bacterium]